MYTPACFAETEQKTLHEFIIGNSFATIISTDGGQPVATHMPLLLEPEFGAHGRLARIISPISQAGPGKRLLCRNFGRK
jgi:predicted FMN-binding regulatory protein PaiB